MLNINIICIGKLKEEYLRTACAEYEKRLKAFCKLSITELTPSKLPNDPNPAQISIALDDEGARILAKAASADVIIPLCIEGKMMSSERLASEIEKIAVGGHSNIAFVIGGSHGLSACVKNKAELKLSMSPMTFPHQLARVMLLEQIYRAFMITSGGKYHK